MQLNQVILILLFINTQNNLNHTIRDITCFYNSNDCIATLITYV